MYGGFPLGATTIINASPPTRSQKVAQHSAEATSMTDGQLARDIVNATEAEKREAYLRELLWRWRDFEEVSRPWALNPDHEPWWKEFA